MLSKPTVRYIHRGRRTWQEIWQALEWRGWQVAGGGGRRAEDGGRWWAAQKAGGPAGGRVGERGGGWEGKQAGSRPCGRAGGQARGRAGGLLGGQGLGGLVGVQSCQAVTPSSPQKLTWGLVINCDTKFEYMKLHPKMNARDNQQESKIKSQI